MRRKSWTWEKERAATVMFLRSLSETMTPVKIAEALVKGDHVLLGELSKKMSSPARKRSRK